MKERIYNIMKEVRPDLDFEKEKKLISDEILDSFDVISIIATLSATFEVEIEELEEENLESIDAIESWLCKVMEKRTNI